MRWIRRPESALFCAIFFCAVSAACASPPDGPRWAGAGSRTPTYGGTFVFHHEDDVRSLDPHVGYDELSAIGLKLLFDGLLDYDQDLNLIPVLAEALPEVSEDGRTFRFRLRRGVRFHNGRELIAEDVRWSMEHMLHPDTACPGVGFYSKLDGLDAFTAKRAAHVRGIRVDGRYAISFVLTSPDQTFVNAMAMTFAHPVPRENYAAHPSDVSRHPIGTGPFVLDPKDWEPSVRIVFRRNPRYWDRGKPYLDAAVFELNLQRDAAFRRFRAGDLDHIHRQSPADFLFLKQSRAWAPYKIDYADVDLWGVEMNCELPPFDNVHVRRAVSFAIDRDRWSRARNRRLAPIYQALPRQIMGYDEDLRGEQRFDLAEARREMARAGYPNGLPEPVTMWMTTGNTGRTYGELTQSDLRRIGIQVELKFVSFPLWLEETGKPKTAQMIFGGWSQDFPDPSNFLDILFHSRAARESNSQNRSFYKNPALDALLDRARVERDPATRRAMYVEANGIVTRDAPWAFLFSNLKTEAWQPYVRGYRPHAVWQEFFRNVWIDLPKRRVASRYEDRGFSRVAAFSPLFGSLPGVRR